MSGTGLELHSTVLKNDNRYYTESEVDALLLGVVGKVPVGGVTAWLKSYTNTPALSSDYVECNGQVLDDGDSIYDTQTIPNLNGSGGTKRFLRGSTTSGSTSGSFAHVHTFNAGACPCGCVFKAAFCNGGTELSKGVHDHCLTANQTAGCCELPDYYEIVWIMRVK